MKNIDTSIRGIALDLDDTILNLRVPMMQALNLATNKAIHWKDWSGHHLETVYDITTEQFLNILIDGNVVERAEPLPGIRDALLRLREQGYIIHIITARGWHPNAMEVTKKWFEEHNLVFDTINIVALHSSKADIMDKLENVTCLVDDNETNCIDVISRGYDAYLVAMPWNSNSTLKRVDSVEQVLDLL